MKRDRERDIHLRLHGFEPPIRFLGEQLVADAGTVRTTLNTFLSR